MSDGLRVLRVAGPDGATYTGIVKDGGVELHALPLVAVASGERAPAGRARVADPQTLALEPPHRLLRPIDPPEVWAAGVTYARSRVARREETEVEDVYSLVYRAQRPELFLKDSACRRTVGPQEAIGVRSDSTWTVPEPELAVVLGKAGEVIGVTAGNDVTARDIEARNPLYLPQAKIFTGCCALGPAVQLCDSADAPRRIALEIRDITGTVKFAGDTSTRLFRRRVEDLLEFARRDNPLPAGSVLLTGTGIVPPDELSLEEGDIVDVEVEDVGTLRNPVHRLSRVPSIRKAIS